MFEEVILGSENFTDFYYTFFQKYFNITLYCYHTPRWKSFFLLTTTVLKHSDKYS
jgi:hypothetical protein